MGSRDNSHLGEGSGISTTVLRQGATDNLTSGVKERPTTDLRREHARGTPPSLVPSTEGLTRLFCRGLTLVLSSVTENVGVELHRSESSFNN